MYLVLLSLLPFDLHDEPWVAPGDGAALCELRVSSGGVRGLDEDRGLSANGP